jgi:(S)-ureidoglycine aminohydrolase
MKRLAGVLLVGMALLLSQRVSAQANPLPSLVVNWADLKVEKQETRARRQILEGATTSLEILEIHTSTLAPGKAPHPPHVHSDFEELIIIKNGKLKVTIKSDTAILGPGSVAYALPGDEHGFENGGDTQVTYYVLKFKRSPLNSERGAKAGGSFMLNWRDISDVKNEKGSRRNFFDRATAMFDRFEMHVTMLNAGLASHAPHTHKAEEIILLISGEGEMQTGTSFASIKPGAVVFVSSNDPHALKNTGSNPSIYFAFQWQ